MFLLFVDCGVMGFSHSGLTFGHFWGSRAARVDNHEVRGLSQFVEHVWPTFQDPTWKTFWLLFGDVFGRSFAGKPSPRKSSPTKAPIQTGTWETSTTMLSHQSATPGTDRRPSSHCPSRICRGLANVRELAANRSSTLVSSGSHPLIMVICRCWL